MIDLYTWDTPNGKKISIALEEFELEYRVFPINIGKDEQFSPEYMKISPNHQIPAIVDSNGPDGKPIRIFESGAILIYFGDKTGRFYPTEARTRVAVHEWLMFQMGSFGPFPGQIHHFRQVENEGDRCYGLARYDKKTRDLYSVMNTHLAENEYFADSEYTITDMAIYGWAWRHPRHKVDLGDYPNVKRWYDQLSARPAVQRGLLVPKRN